MKFLEWKNSIDRATLRFWIVVGVAAAAVAVLAFVVTRVCLLRRAAAQTPAAAAQAAMAESESFMAEETPDAAEPGAAKATGSDLPAVDTASWELRLANDAERLEEDFVPEELTLIESGQSVDARIAEPLRALIAAARADGYTVYFCSGYRDYDTQSSIYWNHIYNYSAQGYSQETAVMMTKLAVNAPGASEHQLGLAADLLEYSGQDMEPYIGGSGLMAWLEERCADFGFVVRYPEDKTGITGVEYEPWHLRYVGTDAAAYIMQNDLCLEEFLLLYS